MKTLKTALTVALLALTAGYGYPQSTVKPVIPKPKPKPVSPKPERTTPAPQPAFAEPEMVYIEGGTFTMGCTAEQGSDCYDNEKPAHSVTLSSFYIGKYEVTQAQWKAVMGNNPSYFKGDNLPVEQVSWDDAQAFIRKLNQKTGKDYRLPTEAEWEYAARGGKQSHGYKYCGGNTPDNVAWYCDNSDSKTRPVGTKQANELGIYDMSGNVWEWCSDWYAAYSSNAQTNPQGAASGSNRVHCGGSWYAYAGRCRVSSRGLHAPGYRSDGLGFRLARSL
jgi:formylglycine-generating enzyme required for sulfatase activity